MKKPKRYGILGCPSYRRAFVYVVLGAVLVMLIVIVTHTRWMTPVKDASPGKDDITRGFHRIKNIMRPIKVLNSKDDGINQTPDAVNLSIKVLVDNDKNAFKFKVPIQNMSLKKDSSFFAAINRSDVERPGSNRFKLEINHIHRSIPSKDSNHSALPNKDLSSLLESSNTSQNEALRTEIKAELPVLNVDTKHVYQPAKELGLHQEETLPTKPAALRNKLQLSVEVPPTEKPSGAGDSHKGGAKTEFEMLGRVNTSCRYAVFSASLDTPGSLNYAFDLPLTALAWRRVGLLSLVILVGDLSSWSHGQLYHHVVSHLRQQDAVVIFLPAKPDSAVMISQVARLLVSSIIPRDSRFIDHSDKFGQVYLITSDADLWPVMKGYHVIQPNITQRILSTNSDCCGSFEHRGNSYKMLPLSSIGMQVSVWMQVIEQGGFLPQTVEDIVTFTAREFGLVAVHPVHKGDNLGWFLDQRLISVLITRWVALQGGNVTQHVQYKRRRVGADRIDRADWHVKELDGIVDAHLVENGYSEVYWERLLGLVERMWEDQPDELAWVKAYAASFRAVVRDMYGKNN